jgi:hypothetical protein
MPFGGYNPLDDGEYEDFSPWFKPERKVEKVVTETLTFTCKELYDLYKWIDAMDPKPHLIKIYSTQTGIGPSLRAEIDNGEGEGIYKDFTDYESW